MITALPFHRGLDFGCTSDRRFMRDEYERARLLRSGALNDDATGRFPVVDPGNAHLAHAGEGTTACVAAVQQ